VLASDRGAAIRWRRCPRSGSRECRRTTRS
jgi:hypothetical protein